MCGEVKKKTAMEFEANIVFKEKYFVMVMRMSSKTHPLWLTFKSPVVNSDAGVDTLDITTMLYFVSL